MKNFTISLLLFCLCGYSTKIKSQTPNITSYMPGSEHCVRGKFGGFEAGFVYFNLDTSLFNPCVQNVVKLEYGLPLSLERNSCFKTGQDYIFFIIQDSAEYYWIDPYQRQGGFLVTDDSVTYKNKRWKADDFLTAIDDYRHEVKYFDTCIAKNEIGCEKIQSFRNKSPLHALFADEMIGARVRPYPEEVAVSYTSRPVISATRMNVLYVGVPNPLNVSIHNQKEQEVFLTISKGKIIKTVDGYVAYVDIPGKTTITVYKDSTLQKSYGSFEYRTKTIPSPYVHLQGSQGGLISKEKLVSARQLDLSFFNFDYEFNASIVSFTVSIHKKNQDTIILYSNNDKITAEMTEAFRNLEEGTKIYFGDIWSDVSGQLQELGTIVFRVGE